MEGIVKLVYHFAIPSETLPWQLIKVVKSAFLADQSSLSRCHSESNCNIAILISKDKVARIYLRCVEFW